MRIMALVLASALAVCFMGPASAASRHSSGAQSANPDRGPLPQSAECGGVSCYRSAHKVKKQKKH
jgi:hypothetical protein